MNRICVIFLVTIALFSACKKSEVELSYTVSLASDSTITTSKNGEWIDTLYYSIKPIDTEEVFVSIIGKYDGSSSSSSQSQYNFEILDQTDSYVVYKSLSKIEIGGSFSDVSVVFTANSNIISSHLLDVKYVTGTSVTGGEVVKYPTNFIIYSEQLSSYNSNIKQYDVDTKKTTTNLLDKDIDNGEVENLALTKDGESMLIYGNGDFEYYSVNGGNLEEDINGYYHIDMGIGDNDTRYYFSSQGYLYYASTNSLTYSSKYVEEGNYYDLISGTYLSSSEYYTIQHYDYYYSSYPDRSIIYDKNGNELYDVETTDDYYLDDLRISDDGKYLAFVEDDTKLKILTIATKQVKTIYSVTSGQISSPDFNGAGTYLAFSYRNSNYSYNDIYTISVTGTSITNITNTSDTNEYYPQWK